MESKAFISAAVKGHTALVDHYGPSMPKDVIQIALKKVKIVNSRRDAEGELDDVVDVLEKLLEN